MQLLLYKKKNILLLLQVETFLFQAEISATTCVFRLWVADKQLWITQKELHFHYQLLTNSSRQSCGGRRQASQFQTVFFS